MNIKEEELLEILEDLILSGVRLFYGDEEIEFGEVTEVTGCAEGILNLVFDEARTEDVSIYDFREKHSKENINLYDWEPVRKMELLMEELS